MYGLNQVLKKFTPIPLIYTFSNYKKLQAEFYSCLNKAHMEDNACHLIKYLSYQFIKEKYKGTLLIYAEPLGIPFKYWKKKLRENPVRELAKSNLILTNFLHSAFSLLFLFCFFSLLLNSQSLTIYTRIRIHSY